MKEETKDQESLLRPKAGALCVNSLLDNGTLPFSKDCPIRTELLAHNTAKDNLAKQIPIDKLLKIEKIALHLEANQ